MDTAPNAKLVAGHELIARDADRSGGDIRTDVVDAVMRDQLVHAFDAGEGCADPDHQGDAEAGEVLGSFQAVGVALAGAPAADPKADSADMTCGPG
jgi:hypothetical protein